jgi:hypothetical protein
MIQWLLEYGGAQITDTNDAGESVRNRDKSLRYLLINAYAKDEGGDYVSIDGEYTQTEYTAGMTDLLRAMVLHGGPPESLTADLAPPLQRIIQVGARLRAQLPAYIAQRRGSFKVFQYFVSSEDGASISETDDEGNTALLLAEDNVSHL